MKLDHVLWCANGLHGVASMLEKLASDGDPPSSEAILNLEKQIARLVSVAEKLKNKNPGKQGVDSLTRCQ